jgi:dihydrofolate reductase
LIANNLLDDLYLFVNPTAIGDGMPVFGHLNSFRRYRLADAQPFDCGIIALHYQPLAS